MIEQKLVDELAARRRRSLSVLPVAVALFAAIGGVVYLEDLHQSEFGFLSGVLVGLLAYWVVLEVMTVVHVGRSLRAFVPGEEKGPAGIG